jgi:hypothetical protein
MTAPLFGRASPMSRMADGSFRYIATVSGSFASTPSTFRKIAFPGVASFPQRFRERATSSAFMSRPLWNFTPRRSLNV